MYTKEGRLSRTKLDRRHRTHGTDRTYGSEPADGLMGQAGGLRDAVSRCAGKSYANRVLQRALVADGNKDRLDPAARPDHRPDHLPAILQQDSTPLSPGRARHTCRSGGSWHSRWSAYRETDPDARPTQAAAGCATPCPSMHEQIRLPTEPPHRLQTHRGLPKRQQARDIRKARLLLRRDRLDMLELESTRLATRGHTFSTTAAAKIRLPSLLNAQSSPAMSSRLLSQRHELHPPASSVCNRRASAYERFHSCRFRIRPSRPPCCFFCSAHSRANCRRLRISASLSSARPSRSSSVSQPSRTTQTKTLIRTEYR